MFPELLETDSLVLERFCRDRVNVTELYDLFREAREDVADVFEYVPQEPYATVKEVHDQLTDAEAEWDDRESAQYAVYADDELAGYTGLFPEWNRHTGRIGFILGKPYWGNGYAGDCATAMTELAFDRLGLETVAIGYEDGNKRSERAIEKFVESAGGQYDGRLRNWTPIGDRIADHHRYTVTREEFRRARADE
ncbi:GNAT family N-acetyltransferase [Natronobacterium haloterrestre]|uniref:GNAT family N-acetyltransferase n=1 Tax=Natronobacterium haloterrestre TaxID=148448 RepID=UPI000B7EA302|nr:GNAT family protein [Halobiforma haloterrestris]